MRKLMSRSRLFAALLSVLFLFNTAAVQAGSIFDNPDIWKNEGVFTPLVPFTSYQWPEQAQQEFDRRFASWSEGMEQVYYQMDDTENERTFNGRTFQDIADKAFIDGYKIGFTYQDRDYRSDYDSQRFDIFRMYASEVPAAVHLYIFAVDQNAKPVVLYLDGSNAAQGAYEFKETANEELSYLFQEVFANAFGQTSSAASAMTSDPIYNQ